MARLLGYTKKELCHFAFHLKNKVVKRKRRKPNGEYRPITSPNKDLMRLLKFLNKKLLSPIPIHRLLYLRPKSSYISMIREHVKPPFLVTADIDDFFPSVKPHKIAQELQTYGFNDKIARFIARLTTLDNKLPQGFPTSSTIANIVIKPVIQRLEGFAKEYSLKVSLYADNLVISSNFNISRFESLIKSIFTQSGFSLDEFKIMTRSDCQQIKNITLNNVMSVRKKIRDQYRKEIYLLSNERDMLNDVDFEKKARSIEGKINFVREVNFQQALALVKYARKLGL